MKSMTITIDAGAVRVGYDLLDDAGPEEIQAALDTLLGVARSARFRALVGALQQFPAAPAAASAAVVGAASNVHFSPFDIAPPPASGDFETSASPALPPNVYRFAKLEVRADQSLRAIPDDSLWSQFGVKLPDAMRREYFRRCGFQVVPDVGVHAHSPVLMVVGEFSKDGKTYPKLESFYGD